MKLKKYLLAIIISFFLITITGCKNKITFPDPVYEIVLKTNGGTVSSEKIIGNLDETTELPIPTRADHIFLGWYKDTYFTDGPYKKFSSTINESVIFYAKWITLEEHTHNLAREKAQAVIELINQLPDEIMLAHEMIINEVNDSYQELEELSKLYVTNYQKLVDAIETINQLKDDEESMSLAKPIIDLINTIPTNLTIEDEELVNNINNQYKTLDEKIKKFVINYDVLLNAINFIEITKVNIELAQDVIGLINQLPEQVTFEDGNFIKQVRAEYEKLANEVKEHVTNYQTLLTKEAIYRVVLSSYAAEFDNVIATLPSKISYRHKEEVLRIYNLYQEFSEELKNQVKTSQRLLDALNTIESIEKDNLNVTYVFDENIFTSKQELFESFFSDFYYFIYNNGGKDTLASKGVNNLESFLSLAIDYDAGRSPLYALGDAFGSFFLQSDRNGVITDQPTTKFVGWCYQNNKYHELFDFLIRFFAYWRIDERYANLSNRGADFFAESWAPTVDICKFFYFDGNTSVVKSERVLECFNNIATVIYGDLPTLINDELVLPTNLKLRGYKFVGWYDNPGLTGDPITVVKASSKKVYLYPKWEKDSAVQDQDTAELVDIYIYNLTPTVSNCTKDTIAKTRKLYNALTLNAKSLVNNYQTLVSLENKYNK